LLPRLITLGANSCQGVPIALIFNYLTDIRQLLSYNIAWNISMLNEPNCARSMPNTQG